MDYKFIKREELYRGRIVGLVVDTVELPSGKQTIREVVRHPGGVVAVPLLDGDRVVFVRQHRYPMDRDLLELPAGKLDPDENPDACVARELEEETGYRAGKIEKLCACYTSPGFCDELLHVYLATELTKTKQRPEDEEKISIETYTLDQALAMIERGELIDAKSIVGVLMVRLRSLARPG